jgi:hypothetical protein
VWRRASRSTQRSWAAGEVEKRASRRGNRGRNMAVRFGNDDRMIFVLMKKI